MSKSKPQSLQAVLSNRKDLAGWPKWLRDEQSEAAESAREFLAYCEQCLTLSEKKRWLKKISSVGSEQIRDKTFEIVAHQFFKQFGFECKYEPKIEGKTPDILCIINKKEYIVDTFMVSSPKKTLQDCGDGSGQSIDTDDPAESRSKKISDKISEKVENYKNLSNPILLVVGFKDSRILSYESVEQALYGVTCGEFSEDDAYPSRFCFERRLGRVLLSPCLTSQKRQLSAVLAIDWFFSENQTSRGYRFGCVVLHHFDPKDPLPNQIFAPFQEVCWKKVGQGAWALNLTGDRQMVAKFSNNSFDFGRYSSDDPY